MKGKTNSHKLDIYVPSEIVTVNVSSSDGNLPEGFEIYITQYKPIDTEYIQLKYIESTGTQYIDTGFKPNQDTRLVIDLELPTQNPYPKAIFGGRDGDTSSDKSYVLWALSATSFRSDFNATTVNIPISTVGRFIIDKDKAIITINNTKYTNTSSTFQSNYNLCICTQKDVGGIDERMFSGKVYSCKIYDNGILIRDYIPAKNVEGVVGLYDKVNKTFSVSQGINQFIGGPEVSKITDIDKNNGEVLYTQTTTSVSYKIPIGTTYGIIPSKEPGYKAKAQTFIASQIKRNVNIVYEVVEYGAFIMDASGNIGNVNDWTSAKGVTGVALITPESEFVIAPNNWFTTDGSNYDGAWNRNTRSAWGGHNKTVTSIKTTTSKTDAITDFAGSANTDAIISQLKGTIDSYISYYTGAPAAEYCRAYSNGCKGAGQWYLPTAGEMNQIALNKAAIEEALAAISGELFDITEWTSTQYDSQFTWSYVFIDAYIEEYPKNFEFGVRPVCKIEDTTGNIITFKIGSTSYLGENQMTWNDWVNSSYNTDGYKNTNNYLCTSSGVQVKFNNSPVPITSLITPSGNYISSSCTVVLNSQWRASSKSNPNSSWYNIYESYSNYNVNSGTAIMYIDIVGYTKFTCYIRSYAESNYDYVMISQLDKTITGSSSYSDTSLVNAHTRGNQQSGTELSNYTQVTYSGIDGGSHRITVVYRKDGSAHSGDDRGYILVPKQ